MQTFQAGVIYSSLSLRSGGSWAPSGNSGRCPFRSHGGDAFGGGHHVDSNDCRSTMGHSTVRGAPNALRHSVNRSDIAIGWLFPAEIAGVVWVRGLSLREYLASFVLVGGVTSLLTFLVFGAMPTLVGRFTAAGLEHHDCGEVDRWKTDYWDCRSSV
jgi:hypothetical protein